MQAIDIAENGDFRIQGMVPSADWKQHGNPYAVGLRGETSGPPPKRDRSEMVRLINGWDNTMIEVVSFDAGGKPRTTARAKLRTAWTHLLSDGLIAGMEANDDGFVTVTIWKLQPE